MLLYVVKVVSFEYFHFVNGVAHPTYTLVCYALGLLDDDRKGNDWLRETASWATGDQLR